MAIREGCSVCGKSFKVMFRYQMEERGGGFAFFCTQRCLQHSHGESQQGVVCCDACAKQYTLRLASQVFYTPVGQRRYACGMECRMQLIRETQGVRLGEIAANAETAAPLGARATEPTPRRRERDQQRISEVRTIAPPSSLIPSSRGTPKKIAVFNHKGGTGKTTTSVNLAAGLAARGYRVLLVDTDSQGNVAVSLGAKCERSLYHVLVMGLRIADATQNIRPGLDILPSNETLAAAELYLAGRQKRDRILSQRMEGVARDYDYIVIDCSPSLSLMNQNALVFADSVLVPVGCDYLSLVGVRQVIKTVKNVNKLLRHPLKIWGVLPTFFDARANICREAYETLRNHFGDRCLTPIRVSTKLKEAPAQASSIFEHAPGTHGAEDYGLLVDAIVGGGDAATAVQPALASRA